MPSWHTLPLVGAKVAIHTAFLEKCAQHLLTKFFSTHFQYKNLQRIYQETLLYVNYSQYADNLPFHEQNLTAKFLHACNLGKAEHCGFYSPVILAMFLANIHNSELHEQMKTVLMLLGRMYQIQVSYFL